MENKKLSGKLPEKSSELTCSMELLTEELPVMNLDVLKVQYSFQNRPIRFDLILRHNIKTLDLTEFDLFALRRNRIDRSKAGLQSVERLILKLKDPCLEKDVAPFVENLCQHMPKLQTLEVSMEKTLYYEDLASQLIDAYDEIIEFKERMEKHLKKLEFCFYGETFVRDDEGEVGEDFWMNQLKRQPGFVDATFDPNCDESSEEVMELDTCIGIMHLNFKASVTVLNEIEYKNFEDDILGSELDQLELNGYDADDLDDQSYDYPSADDEY